MLIYGGPKPHTPNPSICNLGQSGTDSPRWRGASQGSLISVIAVSSLVHVHVCVCVTSTVCLSTIHSQLKTDLDPDGVSLAMSLGIDTEQPHRPKYINNTKYGFIG